MLHVWLNATDEPRPPPAQLWRGWHDKPGRGLGLPRNGCLWPRRGPNPRKSPLSAGRGGADWAEVEDASFIIRYTVYRPAEENGMFRLNAGASKPLTTMREPPSVVALSQNSFTP